MIEGVFEKKTVKNILLCILIVLAAVSLLQGIKNAITDSQDFQWDAMKVFSLRINPYDESVSMNPSGILEQYGYDDYYLQMEANQFPSLLMILLPFAPLSPLAARYVWIVCNIVFTMLILYLLRKTFLREMEKYWFVILSLLMIAGTPYRNQLGVGQHTLFAFCFFLIAVYFSEFKSKRNALVTTFALFVCYFKYTLTAPLALYFMYKKRFKELIVSILMHVGLTFVSAVWLGDSFINMIIKPLKVSSNLAAEGGLDISALLKGSPLAYLLALVIMLALFILSLKLKEGYDCSFMALLTAWSLIITYHRTYDFFVMIVIAGLFTELAQNPGRELIISENGLAKLKIYFVATLFAVFFVLRVFHESDMSKIIVGAMYYILVIIISLLCRGCYGKKE